MNSTQAMKLHQDKTRRTSVSFPQELYSEHALLAKRKKVSMAGIIRDAAEQFIANNYPFFKDRQTKS